MARDGSECGMQSSMSTMLRTFILILSVATVVTAIVQALGFNTKSLVVGIVIAVVSVAILDLFGNRRS